VVVDHKQFPIDTKGENVFGLCDERMEAGGEAVLLIARRHNYGEFD
jgi:hypothetical protein